MRNVVFLSDFNIKMGVFDCKWGVLMGNGVLRCFMVFLGVFDRKCGVFEVIYGVFDEK
jgi:hypothetical protein